MIDMNFKVSQLSSCALPLVMTSLSRCFLRRTLQDIAQLSSLAQRAIHMAHDPEQRQTYRTVVEMIEGRSSSNGSIISTAAASISTGDLAVKVGLFENLLKEVDLVVGKAYDQTLSRDGGGSTTAAINGSSSPAAIATTTAAAVTAITAAMVAKREQVEKNMLVTAQLPSAFSSALVHLFGHLLPALREEIDPAKVYFGDYTWLGLSNGGSIDEDSAGQYARDWSSVEERFWRRSVVDVMRKVILPRPLYLFPPDSSSGIYFPPLFPFDFLSSFHIYPRMRDRVND